MPLLRPGAPEDAGELHVLTRAAFLVEGQRYGDVLLPPLRETLDEVRAALADPGAVVVVAEAREGEGLGRPGRLVGALRARLDGGTAHLARLAVAPDAQRRGIASALVTAVEDAAARRGADRASLFTGAASAGNVALYRRLGYELVPAPERGPGAGTPGLVFLRKALPHDHGQDPAAMPGSAQT